MKVLYIYSGERKNKFQGKIGKDFPDTQFYGLNHLGKFGVDAEYKEFGDFFNSRWIYRLLGFRLRHLLLYFPARNYDIVFGASLLYLLVLKKILGGRAQFVILNTSLTRTLVVNKNNFWKARFLRWLISGADGIVCLANTQKEYLERNFPFLRGKVFFVPLGVDIKYSAPQFEGRQNFILAAGRDNGRDYRTVTRAAQLLPQEELQIVCSPRNMENILKAEIPPNVKIFYDLPPAELQKKYRTAKLALIITHNDSHLDGADCSGQTVLLDALASGLPIIASRKKYLADYVTDGKEALLVDFYRPADIVRRVAELNDPVRRRKLAMAARLTAEERFSTEKMAANLAKIFKELTNKNGRTPKDHR
jgi:glycosyltransferase involved in cell wall biosynthesis